MCRKNKRATRRMPRPCSAAEPRASTPLTTATARVYKATAAMGRQRRRARRRVWGVWARPASEVAALVATALVGVIAALGWLADAVTGASPWWRLLLFAAGVLGLGMGAATLLRGWLTARRWLARRAPALPAGAPLSAAAR